MSWFTKKLRQYVPSTRGKSYNITTGINTFTTSVAGIFDPKHRETLTAGTNIFSSGINKVGSNLFAQDEGSVWGQGSRFLHTMRDARHHPAFGFADKAADYLIKDKYQDVFKGTPNIGIPNIPMPGHGAIKYLNDRTQQLRYVQNKAEMLNAYGNEGIMKGGRFAGDIYKRYEGNPALILGGPAGLMFATLQTATKNYLNKGKGDGEVAEEDTPKPSKIIKGSGSLLGKSARFSTASSGKNQGRSSLKIGRTGTGGGAGASHFKSYKSGRRTEY
jgi:hypothetical protein